MTYKPHAVLFEDQKSTFDMVKILLEEAGYAVEGYTSPVAFFQKPDLDKRIKVVDLLWTDVDMPGMYGTAAAVTFREHGFKGHIILYSGSSPDEFRPFQKPDFTSGNWRGPVFSAIHPKPLTPFELEGVIAVSREYIPFRETKGIYTTER